MISTKTREKKKTEKVTFHQISKEIPLDIQKFRHNYSDNPVVSIPIALSASVVNQFVPRDDQVDLVNKMLKRYFNGFNDCLQSPTGAGKGYMLSLIVANLILIGNRKKVLIIVPSKELVDDLASYFSPLLVSKVYTGSKKVNYQRPIMISTYQSVKSKIVRFNPDLIVSDEAHRSAAKTWHNAIMCKIDTGDVDSSEFLRCRHLGFTATPRRLDGKSLSPYFDGLITSFPVSWYISQGILPDFNLEVIDCPEFSSSGKDDNLSKQSQIFGSAPEIKKTVDLYCERCMGEASLFFVSSVAHGDKLVEEFAERGIEARFIHSNKKKKPQLDSEGKVIPAKSKKAQRQKDFQDFKDGKYDVLINIEIFKEGVNIHRLVNEFQCRFTYSLALYMQMAGRLFRGKTEKTLYDLVGNSLYHGSPKLDFFWTLDGEEPKESSHRIKCPHCGEPLFQRKFLPKDYDYEGCCNNCHGDIIIYADNLPLAEEDEPEIDFSGEDFNLFDGSKKDLISKHDLTRFTRIMFNTRMSDIAKTNAICNLTLDESKYSNKFIAQAKYWAFIKMGKNKSSARFYSGLDEFEE